MVAWLRRAVRWVHTRRERAALAEELETHRAFTQAALERTGMSADDAAAESRRRLGNVTLAHEDAREVWGLRWADQVRQHCRFGLRGLRREPGFAVTAILTLALGTAAATTVFSFVDAEVWRPLPFPDARRLVLVRSGVDADRFRVDAISMADLLDWRRRITTLAALATTGRYGRRTVRDTWSQSAITSEVTANYFDVLPRATLMGRTFTDADAGSSAVVVNERGWRRIFNADPNIVGHRFLLDDEPAIVVGVVPVNDAMGGYDADLFVPMDERASSTAFESPRFYGMFGRLATGAGMTDAAAQLQALLDERQPAGAERHRAAVEDLSSFYRRTENQPMFFLLAASLMVLGLTITNVAGLQLARSLRRTPEFALRGALGSDATTTTVQLIIESALVAVPASAVGLWLAAEATRSASAILPRDLLLRGTQIAVDPRVAAFACAVAFCTTAALALVSWRLVRRSTISTGVATSGRVVGSSAATRLRSALLVGQLAVTVVLMVGGALFLRSFSRVIHAPLGFDPSDGWSMRVSLTGTNYRSDDGRLGYVAAALERVRAIPGMQAAAVATSSPLRSGALAFANPPGTHAAPATGTRTIIRAVSTDYFRAIGTPIIRGRPISAEDVAGAPAVAVVNRAFVEQMFPPAQDPIGQRVEVDGFRAPWVRSGTVTIVGVSDNVRNIFVNEQSMPDIYVPFAQHSAADIEILARGQGSDTAVATALRDAARGADPLVPVLTVESLSVRVTVATETDRFNMTLISAFAVMGMLIAIIGAYGSLAYWAETHTREFGLRLAIGASPRDLRLHAIARALRVGAAGAALGLVATYALAAWIGDALYLVPNQHNGLLYEVTTTDRVSLAVAVFGIIVISLVAGWLPARQVAGTDPVTALRAE